MRHTSFAFLLIFTGMASAADSGARNAALSWSAPTEWVGGGAIPADKVIEYRVYRGQRGQQKALILQTFIRDAFLISQPLGEQCYEVTASVDSVESAPSNEACKIMTLPAPTDGAIEAPTDGAIEGE